MKALGLRLITIFSSLYAFYGPQRWWPGESLLEIAIGAILTQNTNWSNVEKAIKNLKNEELLNLEGLNNIPIETLSKLIKPSGYYNIKAKRVKAFIDFVLAHCDGNIERLKDSKSGNLRNELLTVHGIGPETADSILLYAFEMPVFVIDSYTKRVLSRHGIMDLGSSYEKFQLLFHNELPHDVRLFNEYHALFVRVGKEFCKPKPKCSDCPLYSDMQSFLISGNDIEEQV